MLLVLKGGIRFHYYYFHLSTGSCQTFSLKQANFANLTRLQAEKDCLVGIMKDSIRGGG